MGVQQRYRDSLAFGVEPGHPPYRLRQARYQALAEDVGRVARISRGRPIDLLDVGVGRGVSRRYVEVQPGTEGIRWHGVDLFPKGTEQVYKSDDWVLHRLDAEQGLRGLESGAYDVVLCEQLLEHLQHVEPALVDLRRVLRPGGLLIVGVPSFPNGLHLVRRHVTHRLDKLFGIKKVRSHVQAFTKRAFLQLVRDTADLDVRQVRGFRIVSGGPLRRLEHHRWWWRANRWVGARVPTLCAEIQVLATKA